VARCQPIVVVVAAAAAACGSQQQPSLVGHNCRGSGAIVGDCEKCRSAIAFFVFWRRFATVVRYIRIPVLIVSVYSLGYQQGVIDCTKQPVALQQSILNSVLVNSGASTLDDVDIVSEQEVKKHSSNRHHQVATVGLKIVTAARDFVEENLNQAIQAVLEQLPPGASFETQKAAAVVDATVQYWLAAQLRLNGEDIPTRAKDGSLTGASIPHSWQYVFLKSAAPNAFVTEVLPHRFFITSAMLDVATTPDEVAVVLGHEVSHLILGHVSDTNGMETALRTLEVLLLSMDPTVGIVSMFIMGFLYAARKATSAAYSRDNEREADELGLQLAARACFDTLKGSAVMYKMHQATGGSASCMSDRGESEYKSIATTVAGLMDSHPSTLGRWQQLERAAREGENFTKYDHCASVSSRFFNTLWRRKTTAVPPNKQESNH
jgi:Peptidase family M48